MLSESVGLRLAKSLVGDNAVSASRPHGKFLYPLAFSLWHLLQFFTLRLHTKKPRSLLAKWAGLSGDCSRGEKVSSYRASGDAQELRHPGAGVNGEFRAYIARARAFLRFQFLH